MEGQPSYKLVTLPFTGHPTPHSQNPCLRTPPSAYADMFCPCVWGDRFPFSVFRFPLPGFKVKLTDDFCEQAPIGICQLNHNP